MSDINLDSMAIGTTKLTGPDNYTAWNRSLQAALLGKNLIEHISEELSTIQDETRLRFPINSSSPASEIKELASALYRDKQHQGTTFGIIYHSLSTIVQNRIPESKIDWLKPAPKLLYDWLKETYSATSPARQAELWKDAWSLRVEENQDPQAGLASIQAKLSEVASSAIHNKVSLPEFIDIMTAYAMLTALPSSYGMLSSTILANGSNFTAHQVISAASAEHRRRIMQSEEVNPQGFLARKSETAKGQGQGQGRGQDRRRLGPDGLPTLGRHIDQFCENHQRYGHTTTACQGVRSRNTNQQPKAAVAAPEASPAAQEPDLEAYIALSSTTSVEPSKIIIDSGASEHWICDKSLLKDLVPLASPLHVKVGNGGTVAATHLGTLQVGDVTFNNAYYAPTMAHNLLSVRRLDNANHQWTFTPTSARLSTKAGKLLLEGVLSHGLYVVRPHHSIAMSAEADRPSWHYRLGHINSATINALGRAGKLGKEWTNIDASDAQCPACVQGKGVRLPSRPNTDRASHPADHISADIWGPSPTPSIGGSLYFLTCYDDYSRHVHTVALKAKSDATAALQHYVHLAETQTGRKVKVLRTDQGGEFMSHALARYLSGKGIQHTLTPPDAHTENGRVERAHLTLANDMRTLLIDSGLPDRFWAEALAYSSYVRNRTMINKDGKTPEELWTGRTLTAEHIQPFGQRLFYRVHQQQDKLQPRYTAGRLMGYMTGSRTCRVYNPVSRQFTLSRDVIPKDRGADYDTTTQPWILPVDITRPEIDSLTTNAPVQPAPDAGDKTIDEVEPGAQPPRSAERVQPQDFAWARDFDRVQQLEKQPDHLLTAEDRALVRRWRNYQLEPATVTRRVTTFTPEQLEGYGRGMRRSAHISELDDNNQVALSAAADDNPQSYQEARTSPHWPDWEQAINNELANFAKYDVWETVPHTPDLRPIPGKWVFTRKIDGETGRPAKFKARFVVKGFKQIKGRDYNEIFATVAHKDSIRVLLAIVNHLDLECDQVDIKGAFLNGEIDCNIHISPPEGMPVPSSTVLRLKKSLYGLKQSPHLFNKALDQWLKTQGLQPTKADPCVYSRRTGQSLLLLSIHVDDQLIACTSRAELDNFKRLLNDRFECSDGGPVNYFLGINIHRNRAAKLLYLSQEHYLESLLARFNMTSSQPVKTTLPSGFKPTTPSDEDFQAARHLDFPAMAGGILYAATITRPDLAYAAGLLCRFISKWDASIYNAAKHVLRYIRGTTDLSLTFDGHGTQRVILGYADADWGGCLDTRRSTTGYVFKTYGGIVAWKSRRQPSTALSTTHAELLATTDAARQALWLRQLLDDLGLGLPAGTPVSLYNDNSGAVLLSQHPHDHKMTKHFDIRANYLREQRADRTVEVRQASTEDNLADIFTKPLPSDRHNLLSGQLGVQSLNTGSQRGGVTEST